MNNELPPNPKVTADQVREIRRRIADGEKPRALSLEFPLSAEAIRKIARRETWQHLP
jgi:hypothetical protein